MSFFCYIYFFILPQLQKDRHFWRQLDSTDITQDFNDSYLTMTYNNSKIIFGAGLSKHLVAYKRDLKIVG